MSEIKIDKCQKCKVNFKPHKSIWQLSKKAYEKDEQYTIKEHYCNDCFTELDKTMCWKDYSSYFFTVNARNHNRYCKKCEKWLDDKNDYTKINKCPWDANYPCYVIKCNACDEEEELQLFGGGWEIVCQQAIGKG